MRATLRVALTKTTVACAGAAQSVLVGGSGVEEDGYGLQILKRVGGAIRERVGADQVLEVI